MKPWKNCLSAIDLRRVLCWKKLIDFGSWLSSWLV
jgi:hypothetical protein